MTRALPDHTFTGPDGKSYTLRFSIRAMGMLQAHYGAKSLTEVGQRLNDGENIGTEDLLAILGAGLKANHPDMSADDILDLADALTPAGIMAEVTAALSAAAPARDAGGEGDERP